MKIFYIIAIFVLCKSVALVGYPESDQKIPDYLFINESLVKTTESVLESNDYLQLQNQLSSDQMIQKSVDNPIRKWWFDNKKEDGFSYEKVLTLEKRLNDLVLDQSEASSNIVKSIMNYTAGLKDPNIPIGVFLFLGPTGVGKTELAKALCQELYQDKNLLVRFDMSSFCEPHSASRLIGSPPGYIGSGDGGQLTNPLLKDSKRIILLDEAEKAHSNVLKIFLPVFDEGKITDARGKLAECKNTIFILTSNLCSKEISQMIHLGYSEEEVLTKIEPILINALTPELYNRLEPIVFRPLSKQTIEKLATLMLDQLVKRLKENKKMTLYTDPTVTQYLAKNGYHPELGARPLRRLIDKKVIATISYAIISEKIPDGSHLSLYYFEESDSWHVIAKLK